MSFSRFIALALAGLLVVAFASGETVAQPNCKGAAIFAAPECENDKATSDERALFELVNKYRTANGKPALRFSAALSKLGNRRMLDLTQNMRRLTHSWSNCPYEIGDQRTWNCVTDAPRRLFSGYAGEGYETLYRSTGKKVSGESAIEAWSKSSLHNSIILNLGMFANYEWEEMGVAIDDEYAVLWFGHRGKEAPSSAISEPGLGVTYERLVAGLSEMLSIDQKSSTVVNRKWQGTARGGKLKLEIHGTPKEISEAELDLKVKLQANRQIDKDSRTVLVKMLGNVFPEWRDVDAWLDASLRAIIADRSVSRTKIVRRINVEMSAEDDDEVKISIRPRGKKSYIEVR